MNRVKSSMSGLLVGLLVGAMWVMAFAAEEGAKSEQKPDEQKPVSQKTEVTGKLTEVNATAKSLTVQGKKEAKTFTVTDKTKYMKVEHLELSAVQTGQAVRVGGKVSDDLTSIEAKEVRMMASLKDQKGTSIGKEFVCGTVERSGDALSVTTADGKKVSLVTSAKTRVTKGNAAKFEDLQVGQHVNVRGVVEGNGNTAVQVTILPPRPEKNTEGKAAG